MLDVLRLVGVGLGLYVGVDWLDVGVCGLGNVAGLGVSVCVGVRRVCRCVGVRGLRAIGDHLSVYSGDISHTSTVHEVRAAS